jgi:hypothetical protein
MPFQTGKGVRVSAKVESAFNTAPGATGATQLRLTDSPGMNLTKAVITSAEIRSDALSTIGRHGSRSAPGTYNAEMSVGSHDLFIEAVMRSTWVAATAITQAAMTSITTPTTSTIVAAAGSWITQGVRVGDVIRITNQDAGNNNRNLRVRSVSALTITVVGTPLTVNATPDTSFEVTILKKLRNPVTPTKRTFWIEEYFQDIDRSQVYGGCRVVSMTISGTPDGMASISFGLLGASSDTLTTGASPYYTSPALTTTGPLVFADAKIAIGGVDITSATSFELTYTIAAATQPVVGSPVSPDVFDNDATVSGSLTVVRDDLANADAFRNETENEVHILLEEPGATLPKGCMSVFVPLIKFNDASASKGGDGAMLETIPFMAGIKPTTTGYDSTLLTICTSAA